MSIAQSSSRSLHIADKSSSYQYNMHISLNNEQQLAVVLHINNLSSQKLSFLNPKAVIQLLETRIKQGSVYREQERELVDQLANQILESGSHLLDQSLQEAREQLQSHKTDLNNRYWTYLVFLVLDFICGTSRGMESAIENLQTEQERYDAVISALDGIVDVVHNDDDEDLVDVIPCMDELSPQEVEEMGQRLFQDAAVKLDDDKQLGLNTDEVAPSQILNNDDDTQLRLPDEVESHNILDCGNDDEDGKVVTADDRKFTKRQGGFQFFSDSKQQGNVEF